MKHDIIHNQIRKSSPEGLKKALQAVADEYARRFCDMYDFTPGWWVADDYASTYCTDGMEVSISLSDMAYCVDNCIEKHVFTQWWKHVLESNVSPINLRSWCIGADPTDREVARNEKIREVSNKFVEAFLEEYYPEVTYTDDEITLELGELCHFLHIAFASGADIE